MKKKKNNNWVYFFIVLFILNILFLSPVYLIIIPKIIGLLPSGPGDIGLIVFIPLFVFILPVLFIINFISIIMYIKKQKPKGKAKKLSIIGLIMTIFLIILIYLLPIISGIIWNISHAIEEQSNNNYGNRVDDRSQNTLPTLLYNNNNNINP